MATSDGFSEASSPHETHTQIPTTKVDMNITTDLEDLQTDDQRRVLDTVAEVRKCGLEGVLPLPQLVVCGDQSSGKSSVLEALTGVPFPRNDDTCTRFATEISLRRANTNSLTITVIPDVERPLTEQTAIKAFTESIVDFEELPRIMELAMSAMGIAPNLNPDANRRTFARDVLSIVIEGPSRPQLTLVDIPGLVATSTNRITNDDVAMVAAITDHYISQHRTICLAVVSATNDYANQKILTKVREVDPDGNRTLGIITKPDGLAAGSGAEKSYLDLAKNEIIFFKLGWHVLKNRKFEERKFSLVERNASEKLFFSSSNFKSLPKESVGVDALRRRLSVLLFEHVKNELPKLRQDLEKALSDYRGQLRLLGISRSSPSECKAYLSQLSMDYWEICKAAVNGNYENQYFLRDIDRKFSIASDSTIRRARAVVQSLNSQFARDIELKSQKYTISTEDSITPKPVSEDEQDDEDDQDDGSSDSGESHVSSGNGHQNLSTPEQITHREALEWVKQVLRQNRGKELIGNFNPLVIGELLWEQATKWSEMATHHINLVAEVCRQFLQLLLKDKCPPDVQHRIWSSQIEDALDKRTKAAYDELKKIIDEVRSHPINYNHYYTETIAKRRKDRLKKDLSRCLQGAKIESRTGFGNSVTITEAVNIDTAVALYSQNHEADMENFSCGEALDCLLAIYKVQQKVFVANIATQVIERHIVKGLETIFSPVVVNAMSEIAVEALASEPLSTKREREFLKDRITKLEAGHNIFKRAMSGMCTF